MGLMKMEPRITRTEVLNFHHQDAFFYGITYIKYFVCITFPLKCFGYGLFFYLCTYYFIRNEFCHRIQHLISVFSVCLYRECLKNGWNGSMLRIYQLKNKKGIRNLWSKCCNAMMQLHIVLADKNTLWLNKVVGVCLSGQNLIIFGPEIKTTYSELAY